MLGLEPRTAPRPLDAGLATKAWVRPRMIQLAAMSISLYCLIAVCAAPTSKLAMTIIKPQTQGPTPILGFLGGLNASAHQPSLSDVTVRVGIWNLCVYGVQEADQSTFCSGKSHLPPVRKVSSILSQASTTRASRSLSPTRSA
jgi:hypothetical protein